MRWPAAGSETAPSSSLAFFFSSRRRHTRCGRDWSSDVCSSDLPVAALANMVGSTNGSKISLSAGLAGPGCPMLVAHCSAVLIGLSLEGGVEPNGSFAVTCSSHLLPDATFCATETPGSATDPVYAGKLYSLLPRTASR